MVKLLTPVNAATTVMCEEDQPGVSVIAPPWVKLLEHFRVAENDYFLIPEMKRAMAKELEERYVEMRSSYTERLIRTPNSKSFLS